MLHTRLLTAALAAAALLAILFWAPPWAAQAAVALLLLAGTWEWTALVPLRAPWQRVAYLLLVPALVFVVWRTTIPDGGFQVLLLIALAWWLAALFWVLRYPTAIPAALAAVCGLAVLVPTWLVLAALLTVPADGAWLLLWLLLIVWAADVCAYLTGRRFGRRRLAPRVSPGKTWEGVSGGMLAAIAVALVGSTKLGPASFVAAGPVVMAGLGAALAAVSIVGDLTVSMFKRNVGVKDSGWLFPGHGGVLDRIDSLSAAAPLYLLAMSWLGIWP